MKREDLVSIFQHPQVQAFARVVRAGESSQGGDAYRTMFGGKLFTDFTDHPRQAFMSSWGWTSAAGAYQAMCEVPGKVKTDTWGDFVRQCGPSDFTPASQDLFFAWCINRRHAVADIIAGRLAAAIAKCGDEWASLPGSKYGQPGRTYDQAEVTFRQWGGVLATDTTAAPIETPAPAAPTVVIEPALEKPMLPLAIPAAQFAWGLASSLIDLFSPLAKEKITKEMNRHTDNPAIGAQIANGILDMAKAATGKADPMEAVVAAKADSAIVQKVEQSTLARLAEMAPLLDKIADMEKFAWAAEEASRDAASARAKGDPNDQDQFLTRSVVAILVGLLSLSAILIGLLAYLGYDIQTITAFFLTLGTAVATKYSTRMDHRYGSSRSSAAKDVVIGELTRKP